MVSKDWAGRAALLVPGAVGTAVGIASHKKKRKKRGDIYAVP